MKNFVRNCGSKAVVRFIALLIIHFLPLAGIDLSKKKIAILAYSDTNKLDQELQLFDFFTPSLLKLPARLCCLSVTEDPKRKITFAIDNASHVERKTWYAISKFRDISRVIHDISEVTGDDSENIFYIKKVKNLDFDKEKELRIGGCSKWVTRKLFANNVLSQKLSDKKLCEIVQWAKQRKFGAVIWIACFPTNEEELAVRLISDPVLLKNTQKYMQNFPEVPEMLFEKAIIAGVLSLKKYLIELKGSKIKSVESLSSLSAQLNSLSAR